jgi:carbamate kinase
MQEDSGRGWRRVVASPCPIAIVEEATVRALVESDCVVIAAGGGGIPVVREADGTLRGVEAVIDKDRASALLARNLRLPRLLIVTGVDHVSTRFGKPGEAPIRTMDVATSRRLLEAHEFGAGSMAPKIEAAIEFLEGGGEEVLITSPARLLDAHAGRAGTRIVP